MAYCGLRLPISAGEAYGGASVSQSISNTIAPPQLLHAYACTRHLVPQSGESTLGENLTGGRDPVGAVTIGSHGIQF